MCNCLRNLRKARGVVYTAPAQQAHTAAVLVGHHSPAVVFLFLDPSRWNGFASLGWIKSTVGRPLERDTVPDFALVFDRSHGCPGRCSGPRGPARSLTATVRWAHPSSSQENRPWPSSTAPRTTPPAFAAATSSPGVWPS